jgi:hypothetical protein
MRRLKMIGVAAVSVFAAALGSLCPSPDASAAALPPGPPTAVHATSVAGVRGVTVSWSAPVSDGGTPILYYVASTYSGKHRCVGVGTGPLTCRIGGLEVGATRPTIRVRAVSAAGRGAVAVARPSITGTGGIAAGAPTTAASGGATGSPTPTTGSSAGATSQLPFTGADVEWLFVMGTLALVLGAALRLGPSRRRAPMDSACGLLHR